jgi:hypothetical protein
VSLSSAAGPVRTRGRRRAARASGVAGSAGSAFTFVKNDGGATAVALFSSAFPMYGRRRNKLDIKLSDRADQSFDETEET